MPREAPCLAVADALRADPCGERAVGGRLPSRVRLAVGRDVVRRAVDRLIAEGLLEGRAGSGTYVRAPRERLPMIRARRPGGPGHPAASPAERGRAGMWEAHTRVRFPAPAAIAERLAVAPGDPCVSTHHEFLADGQPVQLSRSREPSAITGGTPIVLPGKGPLAGHHPSWDRPHAGPGGPRWTTPAAGGLVDLSYASPPRDAPPGRVHGARG
ncbi:GntR family transcriptional regulator [Streptomyces sp. KHY 26]|uniref:GntR family transcriptional regulator n=1 Tax=Streptomyces sp. KHY 26 TaxID=3097359 RepID=UPI00376F41D4